MNKVWLAVTASAIAGSAFGQALDVIYTPTRTIKEQGISIRPWGSGTVSETDETAYEGANSIRISTRNLFQGGLLVLSDPSNLTRAYENKNNLLRVIYRVADGSAVGGGGFPGTPGGFPPGVPGGGRPGVGGGRGGAGGGRGGGLPGTPGGFPPGAPGGAMGGPGGMMGQAAAQSTLKTIRVIITTTDGLKSETYLDTTSTAAGDRGWRSVSIPLQAIAGFDRTNKQIKDVALSGDTTATFYLGDLRIVNDSTPINGEARADRTNLALGDEVNFSSYGNGGASILRYTWDFDDKDGIQEDAEGQVVKRRFRKDGTYNVTLTITDRYGLKAPFSTKIKLTVNP